jgi:hypothetical protein
MMVEKIMAIHRDKCDTVISQLDDASFSTLNRRRHRLSHTKMMSIVSFTTGREVVTKLRL